MNLLYAILAGLLPSLVWLFFWTREDDNPEPRSLQTKLFVAGALAVLIALPLERYIATLVSDLHLQYAFWAGLEEVLKFIVVLVIGLVATSNDEPIDAMMYCLTVALGFAALENILFVMGPFARDQITTGLINGNLRFLGASLVHILSTSLIGFSYGVVFYRHKIIKFLAILLGLIAAIAVHASFNISIANASNNDVLRAFGWVWAGVVLLIVLFEEIKAVRAAEI